MIKNILCLQGVVEGKDWSNADFSIEYPEIVPQGRDEIVEEVVILLDKNLITIADALKKIFNLSDEEAEKKAGELENQKINQVPNVFESDYEAYPEEEDKDEEDEEEEEKGKYKAKNNLLQEVLILLSKNKITIHEAFKKIFNLSDEEIQKRISDKGKSA